MGRSRRHLLLLDDNRDLCDAIGALLQERCEVVVFVVSTAPQLLGEVRRNAADGVIVDLGNGEKIDERLEAIRELRRCAPTIGILATRTGAAALGIKALEAGADDVISKPYLADELCARVDRQLSRARSARSSDKVLVDGIELPTEPFRFAGAEIRPDLTILFPDGQSRRVSAKLVGMLRVFAENRGRLVLRSKLTADVWGPDANHNSGSVNQYLHLLRKMYRSAGLDLNDHVTPEAKAGWRISNVA